MKRILITFYILSVSISIFAQNKRAISVEDLWNMKRIESFDVSPDMKKIVFDMLSFEMNDNSENSALWITDTDGKGLVKLTESGSSPHFYGGSSKIYFLKDSQIFSIDADGKNEKQLTDFYGDIKNPEISIDGNYFLYSSKVYPECTTQECNAEKDKERSKSKVKAEIFSELMYRHWDDWRGPKISHLFIYDIKEDKYIDLNKNSNFDVPPLALGSSKDFAYSPTGEEVAFTMNESEFLATSTNNDIYLMKLNNIDPITSFSYTKISLSEGNDIQPVYSPDGKYIAYCSMERAGFESDKQRIFLYNRLNGETIDLTGKYDLSVKELVWSKDSKSIYFTAANKVFNSVYKVDVGLKIISTLVESVNASSLKISSDGRTIYFKNQKSTLPDEIFAVNTDKTNFRKITDVNGKLLSKIIMNEIETFWCEGAEGTKVQSIILKPPFFDAGKKYPMMFLIHGGPQGHWEDEFHYRWNLQMFAAKGYVVIAPNPRGSFGYGQKFTDEVSLDWGGKPYIDLMNCYDYAIENFNFVDPENTFAAGASYGGYMINWIEGHTDRFNALISHAGVFNLESSYGTTEELWLPEWELGGTPWENRELYQKWSPHMYVQNFKTPLLITHGAYDFRVPFSQAMELFTSLQRMNIESKLLYFPDETHFVTKPQNAKLWWYTIYDWLEKHKKGSAEQ